MVSRRVTRYGWWQPGWVGRLRRSANNELGTSEERELAESAARSYRKAIRRLAGMGYLDVWYSRIEQEDLKDVFGDELSKKES